LLVCSFSPIFYSESALRAKIASEPFNRALNWAWGCSDLEGFFSRYLANSDFVQATADLDPQQILINTDDQTLAEYGFQGRQAKQAVPYE